MDNELSRGYEGAKSKAASPSSDSSSSGDDDEFELAENSRRNGMRFSSIEEFLASLNTATTAVDSLKGLQSLSLESYKACMQTKSPAGEQLKIKEPEPTVGKAKFSN
ncbi:uncharacterized protein LOC108606124 [Drosophila busckii]|uniref:uncharacterized protein LOC108606124 n=1 Tax=Drosophila busckii TaxID=30019 RepID=UPI00083EFBC8|nr:uncharacterized protein LOC108606124 [Drosophila busckii]